MNPWPIRGGVILAPPRAWGRRVGPRRSPRMAVTLKPHRITGVISVDPSRAPADPPKIHSRKESPRDVIQPVAAILHSSSFSSSAGHTN
jgi:hypothetical protein